MPSFMTHEGQCSSVDWELLSGVMSPGEAQPALLLDVLPLFCFKECSREDRVSPTRAQWSLFHCLIFLFDIMIPLAAVWMFQGGPRSSGLIVSKMLTLPSHATSPSPSFVVGVGVIFQLLGSSAGPPYLQTCRYVKVVGVQE